ncbi:MAG: hypothetical protein ACP5NV_00485 [Candidatus Woesearchaeota archaeon]
MSDGVVNTGVDELLLLLKENSKLPLLEVSKKLNVSMDVVQAWVDFLVEERILGIEYKFTTPYIYLNKPLNADNKILEEKGTGSIDILFYKNQFWTKAKSNSIPDQRILDLWKNHIMQELELKKKYFFFEAQQRKIKNVDQIWDEYVKSILLA